MAPVPSIPERLQRDGYAVVSAALSADECQMLCQALADLELDDGAGGKRNLLGRPEVVGLCRHPSLAEIVQAQLGPGAFAYKATLFDKTPQANWKVAWHQDLSVPLRGSARPEDWRAWSIKAGVLHAQPPDGLLSRALAIRVHLDDCAAHTGALRVVPGSHQAGRLDSAGTARWKEAGRVMSCEVRAGDLLLMRPLLLHASSASSQPAHRRVIHLEFANEELPDGLDWAERVPVQA